MIHAVICKDANEKAAAVKIYTDLKLSVTSYGPDDFVQCEKFAGNALADCADCALNGPGVFLVVACPAGMGPH